MSIRVLVALPTDAAKRLVTLLNSDTPEGKQARVDLQIETAKLITEDCDVRIPQINHGV